jgi:hypothetical protein
MFLNIGMCVSKCIEKMLKWIPMNNSVYLPLRRRAGVMRVTDIHSAIFLPKVYNLNITM